MPGENQKPFVVTNTSASMRTIAGQSILPGKSVTIDPKYEEGVRKSPAFRAGILKEGSVTMPEPKITDISKLSVEQAKKLIASESTAGVLMAWIDQDSRPEIRIALDARVKQL